MINRRLFLGILSALSVPFIKSEPLYGQIDVDNCFAKTGFGPSQARVYLNDVDVTQMGIRAFNDRECWIDAYDQNPDGTYKSDGQNIAIRRVYGKVRVKFVARQPGDPLCDVIKVKVDPVKDAQQRMAESELRHHSSTTIH